MSGREGSEDSQCRQFFQEVWEKRERVVAGGAVDLVFQLIFNYNEENMNFSIRHIWF